MLRHQTIAFAPVAHLLSLLHFRNKCDALFMPANKYARTQSNKLKPITDDVTWTRILDPRESYQIEYIDAHGELTERIIDLLRIGHIKDVDYLAVMHAGKFKTLRADNVRKVRQLSHGHEPSITAAPTYAGNLPAFPLAGAIYKMPTVALSNRTWTVDLNLYTCTCPEKRLRSARGYQPGQLGAVCPHIARAILEYLPESTAWPSQLRRFLSNPRKVHIDNLT